jgi:hypothetical protein
VWRILTAAGERGDPIAIDAVWRTWLRHPDEQGWESLRRWRFLPALTGPSERAMVSMLTGQLAQYRAVDPDGSALAEAYRAAAEPVRAALRQAMAASGDLDVVRVVAAHDRDQVPETEAERSYLVGELARRGDWSRLWRLALDLPLAETVAAARRLPAEWRPPDDAAWPLLAALAAADPVAIGTQATTAALRVDPGPASSLLDIAPDGSEAVVIRDDGRPRTFAERTSATVYSLPGGDVVERFYGIYSLMHFGDISVCVDPLRHCLTRRVRGVGTDILVPAKAMHGTWKLIRVPGGFVATDWYRLLHGTPRGREVRDILPPDLGVGPGAGRIEQLVSEPRTGSIAFRVSHGGSIHDELVVLGSDFQVIAKRPLSRGTYGSGLIGFSAPGRVIIHEAHMALRSWTVGSSEVSLPGADPDHYYWGYFLLPLWRIVVRLDREGPDHYAWTYLDAESLEPAEPPSAFTCMPTRSTTAPHQSPDGCCVGVRIEPQVMEIHDLVREEVAMLLRRPLARLGHADLAAAAECAGRLRFRVAARQAVDLLRACLEYRFATEVAIGEASSVDGTDDIGLTMESG